ncbi:putative bifunctional nuclease [Arabidopsis thaliana]|nr:hypothetical protein [Arabidopsis thaliana]CAB36803.1 putative bifunctional nuclease [Arabidopsis thaliana]CAB81266.1 putative bifunctional nuclease [Arabidopsis thaliana]
MQLMSASENSDTIVHYNLTEALMFLSHFIGDIHQPLHVGFLGDEGGNTITVRWYRRKTNLHHVSVCYRMLKEKVIFPDWINYSYDLPMMKVWDNMIIESALKTYYNKSLPLMIEALQANLTMTISSLGYPLWRRDLRKSYFEEDTVVAVKKLLPESANGELAAVCSWPDEIKKLPQWRWTSALHFADTPDYKCNYEYSHNLTEALMFLSHYMGDIHQPLHEGFIGDLGGNKIKVHWYNQETNLHRVWDDMIIESALETYYNSSLPRMIHELQAKLKNGWSNDVPSWESCQLNQTACPNPYASESIDLACKYAYRNATAGTTLGDYYFVSRLPVVEKRLAQGGIRLAGTLNRIFSAKRKLARA